MDILTHLSANLWEPWLIIAVILLILELMTGGLYIICFAFGAAAASLVALVTGDFDGCLIVQLLVWAIASALSLFCIRPLMRNYLHKEENVKASNADAIIGRIGVVSEDIEAGGYGRVAIDGDDWKALSADGVAITKGTKVSVVSRDSIILKVEIAYNEP